MGRRLGRDARLALSHTMVMEFTLYMESINQPLVATDRLFSLKSCREESARLRSLRKARTPRGLPELGETEGSDLKALLQRFPVDRVSYIEYENN